MPWKKPKYSLPIEHAIRSLRYRIRCQTGEDISDKELIRILTRIKFEKRMLAAKRVLYDQPRIDEALEYLKNPSKIEPKKLKPPKNMKERYVDDDQSF